MPTTYYGYYYPDAGTELTPLAAILAAMAASSDAAHRAVPTVFNTIAERDASLTTPTEGRVVYTKDYDILWYYNGSAWFPVGVPTFANITERNAAIPSPTTGMSCILADTKAEYRCITSGSWALWSLPSTTWTPTIAGVTAGLSVGSAKYAVSGGVVRYYVELTCTGALTGSALRLSGLPVSLSASAWTPVGDATLNPNGTRVQGKVYRYSSVNEVAIFGWSSTGVVQNEISASSPATWVARSQAIIAHWSAPTM